MRIATGHTPTLSRRSFVTGGARVLAAGAGALVLSGTVLTMSGCSRSSSQEVQTLQVADNAVVTLDAFNSIKNPERRYRVEEIGTYNAGTIIKSSGKAVGAAFCAADTADPLNTIGLIDLKTGKLATVLEKPVGYDNDYGFYSATTSDSLLVWVESNFLTSDWVVYCASVTPSSLSIGQPVKLDEGNADYDAPEIAAIDSTAYWIYQPSENGSKSSGDSLLKAASGGSAAAIIHTSHGRFNGGLTTSGQTLCAMPRADTSSGVYYQLTAFQNGTGSVVASQVLPRSFQPTCAIYINGGFSFAIDASYDYGDGISLVGTYYPLGNNQWLRLTRQPVTPPGLCKGWMFCKSGSRTVLVDLSKYAYLTVDAPDSSTDYGDYSVGTGEVDAICNYAMVTKVVDEKQTMQVVLRRITPTAAAGA